MMTPTADDSTFTCKMVISWRRRISLLLFIVIVIVFVLYSWSPYSQNVDRNYITHNVTLFTLNIWFGNYKTKERMTAIGKTIESLSPSIVTFQEVTSQNIAYLQSQPWFGRYHMAPSKIPRNQGYFVIILSLYPITKWQNISFTNSRMNRHLLLAELSIDIETPDHEYGSESKSKHIYFTIATSHLESMAYTTQEREQQLQQSLTTLSKYDDVCLMGDLNLELKVDGEIELPSPWFDVWLSVAGNSHYNGYTWDPTLNTNTQVSEPGTTKDRFDRVLCKCLNFAVQSIIIVGTQPIDSVFLSDHFALYTMLKVSLSQTRNGSQAKKVRFKRPKDWKKYMS